MQHPKTAEPLLNYKVVVSIEGAINVRVNARNAEEALEKAKELVWEDTSDQELINNLQVSETYIETISE